jgi:uncharacterized membrane protein
MDERSSERGGEQTMAEGFVQYLIVAFPENRFSGKIAPAIAELVDNGTIRVIDLAFVMKDAEGNVSALEYADLAPEVAEAFAKFGDTDGGLFNEDDFMAAGEELEPNSSAALLVWENVWAARVTEAIREAGGVMLDFDVIPADVIKAAREYAAQLA